MWGPCACPRGGLRHLVGSEQHPTEAHCDQDKHKAPSLPHIHPLSLQDAGVLLLLDSVVKIHQDGDIGMTDLAGKCS